MITREKTPSFSKRRGRQRDKKASQSSRPQTRKMGIIFHCDMCVGKNTAQQTVNLLPEKPEVFRQPQKTPPLPKRRRRLWRG